jgi:cytochrome oxidase assembly protein ShyY1
VTTRFWLRPKWIFGHILCLVLVVVFIECGFWQLRRLHEKQDRNELIHAREDAEPTSLDDALRAGPDGAVYRRVEVTGRWDAEDTFLVRSRSLDERPGFHVLTPLVVGDEAVIVNRGFAPLGGGSDEDIISNVAPKDHGTVTVSGMLRASETRGSIGPKDRAGRQLVVNRIDVPRLQQQVDHDLVPVYLQLTAPAPKPNTFPELLPLPTTDEGPHRSYAIQWFIFATVGIVGWPLLLRKQARDLAREGEGDEADDEDEAEEGVPTG